MIQRFTVRVNNVHGGVNRHVSGVKDAQVRVNNANGGVNGQLLCVPIGVEASRRQEWCGAHQREAQLAYPGFITRETRR